MRGKPKFICLTFLVCMLFFGGCDPARNSEETGPAKTQAERRKAELLNQIERRFENPQAHFELGQLYQADGMWPQAENEYSIALSFDPVHYQAQAARVKVLLESGDNTKAEFLKEEYINQASTSASASLNLALGFQKQAFDEEALKCYERVLELAPNSAKIHRQIGFYYRSKNDLDRARDYLTRSFQINPNQPEVAGELGRLGVAVRIPQKQQDSKSLDKIVEKSDKDL